MAGSIPRKYPNLSGGFLRGSRAGQIHSVHRTRLTNRGKVEDFRRAIADGDISLEPYPIPRTLAIKLVELGVPLTLEQVGTDAS